MSAKKGKAATAALNVAAAAGITFRAHEYEHDASAESYGLEAAEKLSVDTARVFKTLVATDGAELFVAVVPVERQLDLKALATALTVKSVQMAEVLKAERVTGYVAGGISPLGQKKRLRTVIDSSAEGLDTMYVSAGRRGLEIELASRDLLRLTDGAFAEIAR